MRVAAACAILACLFVAEACHQRRRHMMHVFLYRLEDLQASLGDLQLSVVTMRSAYQRFATSARRVLEEGRRRAGQP